MFISCIVPLERRLAIDSTPPWRCFRWQRDVLSLRLCACIVLVLMVTFYDHIGSVSFGHALRWWSISAL